ncbi:MAG: hypothetical protein II849_04980 [Bacteroidales bacterium]|nr:hypothetical protein [Bacteroidales bacterium]
MKKKTYTAPVLTVVEFRSERGFAVSTVVPEVGTFELFYDQPGGQETEVFSVREGWGDEPSNGFWN